MEICSGLQAALQRFPYKEGRVNRCAGGKEGCACTFCAAHDKVGCVEAANKGGQIRCQQLAAEGGRVALGRSS